GNDRLRLGISSYNGSAAQAVLPARLTGMVAFPEFTSLDVRGFDHPVFSRFQFFDGGFAELSAARISKRWGVDPSPGTAVIASYSDARRSPALVVRLVGKGRVLMLTTGLDRKGWSILPLAGPSFLVLCDQMVHYLS